MKKRMNKLTAMLVTLVLMVSLMPAALAATTVDPENDKGSIELNLKASGMEVTVYRIGTGKSVDSNLVFELQDALKDKLGNVELNGLKAVDVEAVTKQVKDLGDLSKLLPAEEIWTATTSDKVGEKYPVKFAEVPVGVYLVVQTKNPSNYENFDSFLLYLPVTTVDGADWDNSVQADPKADYVTSGGGGGGTTPDPEIIIPDPDVPLIPGETPEEPLEEIPEEEVPLAVLPQTGLLQWPIPVMAAVGLLLIALGLMSEQKRKAQNN